MDLAFDAVGGPMFESSLGSLRMRGRQIAMAAAGGQRWVEFDLVEFFHGLHRLIGVDSNTLTAADNARIMGELAVGLKEGKLQPRSFDTWSLEQSAAEAYKPVAAGAASRQVIVP